VEVVAGNIATAEGARAFNSRGADAGKWGLVGQYLYYPHCFGLRVPQITAILDVWQL